MILLPTKYDRKISEKHNFILIVSNICVIKLYLSQHTVCDYKMKNEKLKILFVDHKLKNKVLSTHALKAHAFILKR